MNRIDRLFGIMTQLQSKRFVPAEKIAERFQISVRTVYRDIKALNEQGVPVSFEPTKGYFIVNGYFIPPVAFNSEEANALLLMESVVYAFTDKSIQAHYSNAVEKIKAVLKYSQKEKLEQLNQKIKLQLPPCFQNDYEYLSVLQESISAMTVVQFDYKNNKNEVSQRTVEPIGLIFYAMGWHLIGWCCLRQDYRDFKVARILKVQPSNRQFEKKVHISVNDYMKLLPVDY
ncbi:MAG: YafY family protein [Ferruginibacter sp.]|nr:YafY family protein [Ferruginibacter sp.]